MNINGLSPLQNWLERIHGYLTREEILKARFASLILPIFEAYELLTVVKKICFISSRQPDETYSDLTAKASTLALNVLFAGYRGFRDPQRNYEYHKENGLVVEEEASDDLEFVSEDDHSDPTLNKNKQDRIEEPKPEDTIEIEKIEKNDFISKEEPKKEDQSEPVMDKGEKIGKEDSLPQEEPKKELPGKSQAIDLIIISPRREGEKVSPRKSDDKSPLPSPRKLDDGLSVLKAAPHIAKNLERKASITQEGFRKQYLAQKGKSQSEPSKLRDAVVIDDPFGLLSKSLDIVTVSSKPVQHPRIGQIKLDQHSLPGIGEEVDLHPLSDEQLEMVLPLLKEEMVKKTGSWKVKDKKVQFTESARLNIDPGIINILAKAQKSGYLAKINFDQTFMLYQNLKTIEKYLGSGTLKGNHFKELSNVKKAVQTQFISMWIASDYLEGTFYQNCMSLISQMVSLIRAGKGLTDDSHIRLFEEEEEPSADVAQIFEEWKYASVSSQLSDVKLSIYDYYEILKAYFDYLPESIQKCWHPVKFAQSQAEWLKEIQALPKDDVALIMAVFSLLKEAHQHLWKSDLDEMIIATEHLFTHFCPYTEGEEEESGYLEYDYIKNQIKS